MKAKEMFEKLGYKIEENETYITYENNKNFITFNKKSNEINISMGGKGWYSTFFIDNIELLQAINKKVEELGWNK